MQAPLQVSVVNQQTPHLWNTQLPQIGVHFRSSAPSVATPEPPLLPKEKEDLFTPLSIHSVHLRKFVSLPGEAEDYTDIPVPQDIHLDKLLQALHQVGEHFNQENALRLHSHTKNWVKAITAPMNLPHDTHCGLSLKGTFGEIELDLAQLDPQKIQHFFVNSLAHCNTESLRQQYAQLGDHTLISTGFSESEKPSEADQKAQTLIALADALEQKLDLAPNADHPDILSLLKDFLHILRQLELDSRALQKNQQTQALQAKKISDHFSQQLQSRCKRLQLLAINSQHPAWGKLKTLSFQ